MAAQLYDQNFYAWANERSAILRAGRILEADIENIAKEIESMGKSEKRELAYRLSILLLRLLKWQYQPGHRSASWQATIRVQRRDLSVHLADNPSLKRHLPAAIDQAYGNAVIEAAAETGLGEETFTATCPWTYEQIGDPKFWPIVKVA